MQHRSIARPRVLFPWLLVVGGSAFSAVLPGCSGGDAGDAPSAPPRVWEDEAYGLTVREEREGTMRELRLLPVEAEAATASSTSPREDEGLWSRLTQSVAALAAPSAPDNAPSASSWLLVQKAALQCGESEPASTPWLTRSDAREAWFMFLGGQNGHANTCAEVSRRESVLLCVADKLAQVGDAVAPLVWTVKDSGGTCTYPEGGPDCAKWTIPPQTEENRFIVRDLAMAVLAHVPYADAEALWSSGATQPSRVDCNAAYARAASGADRVNADYLSEQLFGVPLKYAAGGVVLEQQPRFPAGGVPVLELEKGPDGKARDVVRNDNTVALAKAALETRAQTLRASSQLLRDLVRRSVYADLAGSDARIAKAASPARSGPIAWGEEGRYNSLAHASRVLTGRWEIGGSTSWTEARDPRCTGTAPLDVLPKAYGADVDARRADEAVSTPGQGLAVALVERAGVALPLCRVATATDAALQDALADQLRLQSTESADVPGSIAGELYKRVVASVSASDLRFAFRRSSRTYRMLTSTAEPTECVPVPMPSAGLKAAATSDRVQELGGVALQGGIARSRLTASTVSRSAAVAAAAQCNVQDGSWLATGALDPNAPLPAVTAPKSLFQSVFHMGRALERRMNLLADAAQGAGTELARSYATVGAAETRSWAGSLSATAAPMAFTADGAVQRLRVTFLAKETPTAARTAFAFVYGPAWVAECAAGLRATCPDDFEKQYVRQAFAARTDAADLALRGEASAPLTLEVTTPTSVGPQFFRPRISAGGSVPGNLLYVIRRAGDAQGDARIVGAFALRESGGTAQETSLVEAPLQRELLGSVLGLGRWVGEPPTNLGGDSAARSAGYCVAGVDRNVAVPVGGALLGDGTDVFDAKMREAEASAAVADALGKELLEGNLRVEERAEAAREALMPLCGVPLPDGSVVVGQDGKIAPATNASLPTCLGEPTVDITFLGTTPTDLERIQAPADRTKWLKEKVLRCDARAGVSKNPLCGKETLSANALGLIPRPKPATGGVCSAVSAAKRSLRTGLDVTFAMDALRSRSASDASIQALVATAKLTVDLDGSFSMASGALVDSRPNGRAWPGCLRTPDGCPQSEGKPQADPVVRTLNTLFRACPPGVDENQAALGACEPVPMGTDPVDAELTSIRWRLTGALSLAGTLAGGIPARMFTIPMPAFSREDVRTQGGRAPLFAAYPGRFVPKTPAEYVPAGLRTFALSPAPSDYPVGEPLPPLPLTRALRTLTDVPAAFRAFSSYARMEMGDWYPELYQSQAVRHFRFENPPYAVRGNQRSFGRDANGVNQVEGTPDGQPFSRSLFAPYFQRLDGMTCGLPAGSPSVTRLKVNDERITHSIGASTTDEWSLMELVARMKTRVRPEFVGDNDFGGLTGRTMTPCFVGGYLAVAGNCFEEVERSLLPAWRDRVNQRRQDEFFQWAPAYAEIPVERTDRDTYPLVFTPYADYPGGFLANDTLPATRAAGLLHLTAPAGDCNAASEVLQTLGLACLTAEASDQLVTSEPPTLERPEDLGKLEAWIKYLGDLSAGGAAGLYVENVPTRIVEGLKNGAAPIDAAGAYGNSGAEIVRALTQVPSQWASLRSNLIEAGLAVKSARIAIQGADLAATARGKELSRQQFLAQKQQAKQSRDFLFGALDALGGAVAGAVTMNPLALTGAFSNLASGIASHSDSIEIYRNETSTIDALQKNNSDTRDNQLAAVLTNLNQQTVPLWTGVVTAMGTLRTSAITVSTETSRMKSLQDAAAYNAAKSLGVDVIKIGDKELTFPVNTVLRRLNSATEVRYRRALDAAKTNAYLARRALEQKLGVPLTALTTGVGGLEAPALWADDVCRLSGINYASLRSLSAAEKARRNLDDATITQLSNSYIGDYVQRLRGALTVYSQTVAPLSGRSTAVLSLRSDILSAPAMCTAPSTNLLRFSGALDAEPVLTPAVEASGITAGWLRHACPSTSAKCSRALPGAYLAAPYGGPDSAGLLDVDRLDPASEGVSWLLDGPPPATEVAPRDEVEALPAGMLSGAVTLTAGPHVLSWWDQARSPLGELLTDAAQAVPYRVFLYTADGVALQSRTVTPFVPTGAGSLWSARQTLLLDVPADGVYRVAFAASTRAETRTGSVALARIQLERSQSGEPGPYEATGATLNVVRTNCPLDASDLRGRFERRVLADGTAWYVLREPFEIRSELLRDGRSQASERIARGNYNYRHASLAVVGVGPIVTGADRTLEYSLLHDATDVTLAGPVGAGYRFNFLLGPINSARGLAREGALFPILSQTDAADVAQVRKGEFLGRPLDGRYTLSVRETPNLRWDQLQDVQIVLDYSYWASPLTSTNAR